MKTATIALATALSLGVSLNAQSAPQLHSGHSTLQPEFSTSPIDVLEQHLSTGRFAILPWVFGVTSIDLALIGVYWGIYVPDYADVSEEQIVPEELAE